MYFIINMYGEICHQGKSGWLEWWYKNVNGQRISNLILVDHTTVCAKFKSFVCGSETWTINSDIDSSGKILLPNQTTREKWKNKDLNEDAQCNG